MHSVFRFTAYLSTVRACLGSAMVALLAFGLCGAAAAQGPSNTTFTVSTSRSPDTFVDTILPTIRVDTFRTRLIGLLQGDPTLYYDQTFAVPFADASVQNGLLAAQAALDAASPDPLNFVGPSLLGSLSALLSSVEARSVTGETLNETVTIEETIGPGFTMIGARGPCEGLLTPATPLSLVYCPADPQTYDVVVGTSNFNANSNLQVEYTRDVQTTETWELFQTWQIVGVPELAQVPAPAPLALLAIGLMAGLAARRRPA